MFGWGDTVFPGIRACSIRSDNSYTVHAGSLEPAITDKQNSRSWSYKARWFTLDHVCFLLNALTASKLSQKGPGSNRRGLIYTCSVISMCSYGVTQSLYLQRMFELTNNKQNCSLSRSEKMYGIIPLQQVITCKSMYCVAITKFNYLISYFPAQYR